MSQIIKGSTTKRIVPTRANTPMTEWIAMLRTRLADFVHVPTDFVSDLRAKHAWEGGDSVEGFASHIEKQVTLRNRTLQIKQANPQNYK
jgi:hypothetical protein